MKGTKRLIALLLVACLTISMFSGCAKKKAGKGEPVVLEVYSQLANYSGEMTGWFAELMLQKFNVKINLIADGEGVYETRMESGDLGDIVVWGSDGEEYLNAVNGGLLFDWEEDDLLADYGPYIKEHMNDALEKNREVSGTDKVYGFGHNVASSSESHESFFYTWDIRWDLYEDLGHPEVNNLDDLLELFKDMQELDPTDDAGNPTYAMSLWPDWDGNMVMYVKAMVTAYYGHDELGLGNYDVNTGEFYYCLDPSGPYMEMLEFFNKLYREGLLDPDSMTQTYDKMIEKVQNGGVFFSIFNYAGNAAFNSEEHIANNEIMRSLVPSEATPIVYGMSTYGGNRVWSIGAKTQYPELCMEIINWLCTPEGRLTMDYGPKGVCWDYDENGKTYFTDFGKTCVTDRTTLMPEEWGGGTFNDGAFQVNNTTWSSADINPESGEKYDKEFWASNQTPDGENDADKDWREYTGCVLVEDYMEQHDYAVSVATTYAEGTKTPELKVVWEQLTTCIVEYSWRAIYAETEEDFDAIVSEMIGVARSYDPQQKCLAWCENEAAVRNALEEPLRK
ncbi:MAG: hypothetical protein IJZ25_03210 [Lachnospiraceae bacterium]|nr:hypothetical protein [Lachnospiraceae bacterium]